jgi:uncharacterized protein (DUF427 family)
MKPEPVWDYPRPPAVEAFSLLVRVEFDGIVIAKSRRALRLLETSHPPSYYIPADDVRKEFLTPGSQHSFCEFKGVASYWDIVIAERRATAAAWSYQAPTGAYTLLKDHIAFYADRVDACYVDDELVQPQPGGFYGGWITSNLKGPFKGVPGSLGW